MSKIFSAVKVIKQYGGIGFKLYVAKKYGKRCSDDVQAYEWVDKKYGDFIDNINLDLNDEANIKKTDYSQCIWVCWLQEIENAPILVKRCYESIVKNSNGHKVILLDYKKIREIAELPNFIYEKYEKGLISHAHFTDIVRAALLYKFGGIWIDATVYISEKISETFYEMPIFCFKKSHLSSKMTVASSWFIAAKVNNEILGRTYRTLIEYWKTNNKLVEYFLFHYIFSRTIEANENTRKMWRELPYYNNVNPHVLQYELKNKYDKERWQYIRRISTIHKLTYIVTEDKESFYGHIIDNKLT